MVIEGLNLIRQMVWKQALDAFLAAVLNRLIIIPAFESEHIQNLFMCAISASTVSFCFSSNSRRKGYVDAPLHAPVHKLLDVLDLQSGAFEALDHTERVNFGIIEFADADTRVISGNSPRLS